MAGDRVQALVFGEVAQEYDRVRPGYPSALIDDVLAATAPEPTALDIGAGTGKATALFAARGARITALEPDPAMALILRQRVVVNIAMTSLESYEPDTQYDLVYSAQAFHWTAPETRWARTAAALRPGGTLALFWNQERVADRAVRDQVFAIVHERVAVAPAGELPTSEGQLEQWPQTELAGLADFGELRQRVYRWQRELSRADYLTYLTTQSAYRMLEDEEREELVDELRTVLPDQVVLDGATVLDLAKRV
jgi:SAM-dependent methyltransferase